MADKKKPRPPVPGRPKPTSAKKKPAEKRVPVTSVTPRSTVKKPSAKQVAGTRKVVGALAAATPIGRGVKAAAKAGQSARSFATLYPNPIKRGAKGASNLAGKAINARTKRTTLDGIYYTDGVEKGIRPALQARKIAKSSEKLVPKNQRLKAEKRALKADKRALKSVNTKKYTKKK